MNWAISHLAQRKEFQRITEKGKVFKDRGSHKKKKKKDYFQAMSPCFGDC